MSRIPQKKRPIQKKSIELPNLYENVQLGNVSSPLQRKSLQKNRKINEDIPGIKKTVRKKTPESKGGIFIASITGLLLSLIMLALLGGSMYVAYSGAAKISNSQERND